jgi:hypothetical protein
LRRGHFHEGECFFLRKNAHVRLAPMEGLLECRWWLGAAARLARRAKRASLSRVERSETRVLRAREKKRFFLNFGTRNRVTRNRRHARNRWQARNRC